MGWIAACVLVALLLPLMAMVYLDNLTVNKRTEKNLEKTEKLERQVQELKREIERKKDE
jgi:type II secretory pathway component PulJ